MSSPQPQSEFPHAEVEALDRENVARLLEINVKFQSFFRKHPFFENDPVCRLARQLCLDSLPDHDKAEADRLVTNGGYELHNGPSPGCLVLGPGIVVSEHSGRWTFLDFLVNGNHPRPIWMAWGPQAAAALDALKKLDGAADA